MNTGQQAMKNAEYARGLLEQKQSGFAWPADLAAT
jgi:hypothetical protein